VAAPSQYIKKCLEDHADIAATVTTKLAQKTSTALTTNMARLIAVTGATGNQGGSVAKLLLKYPTEYRVRAITRDAHSSSSKALEEMGAEVVEADLTKPETLPAAVYGCWGVFGVTNFYDAVCARRGLSAQY
jgi:nucleoside-diphosphate-sugar epimerase